jgi:hypothetical protein
MIEKINTEGVIIVDKKSDVHDGKLYGLVGTLIRKINEIINVTNSMNSVIKAATGSTGNDSFEDRLKSIEKDIVGLHFEIKAIGTQLDMHMTGPRMSGVVKTCFNCFKHIYGVGICHVSVNPCDEWEPVKISDSFEDRFK